LALSHPAERLSSCRAGDCLFAPLQGGPQLGGPSLGGAQLDGSHCRARVPISENRDGAQHFGNPFVILSAGRLRPTDGPLPESAGDISVQANRIDETYRPIGRKP
jgi:hypothetical protein